MIFEIGDAEITLREGVILKADVILNSFQDPAMSAADLHYRTFWDRSCLTVSSARLRA